MPLFIPKTKFADFLQFWALNQEIPIWTSTKFLPNPTYEKSTGEWTVRVDREGTEVVLHPRHLIFATGLAARPSRPLLSGIENFKGTVIDSHSFKNANGWKGKKVVIIGAVSTIVSKPHDMI